MVSKIQFDVDVFMNHNAKAEEIIATLGGNGLFFISKVCLTT